MNYTPEDLDTLQDLADAATPGPWYATFDEIGTSWIDPDDDEDDLDGWTVARAEIMGRSEADAALIAVSRTAIPALISDLREAYAEIERLRADLDVPCHHHHERDSKAIQRIRNEIEKLETGAKRNKTPSMYPDYEDGVLSAVACVTRALEGK